jgi:hypothetical protein
LKLFEGLHLAGKYHSSNFFQRQYCITHAPNMRIPQIRATTPTYMEELEISAWMLLRQAVVGQPF